MVLDKAELTAPPFSSAVTDTLEAIRTASIEIKETRRRVFIRCLSSTVGQSPQADDKPAIRQRFHVANVGLRKDVVKTILWGD